MKLSEKTILILSPQSWGTMFLSKHQYAVALANRGNQVFFLNPPEQKGAAKSFVSLSQSEEHPNLHLIHHGLFFPYKLKFKLPVLFHFLMRFHIVRILKRIGRTVDIVWSFDIGYLYPLSFFPKSCYKVFHPVDEPLNVGAIKAAKSANIIFSVTEEILNKYHRYHAPRYFINHGVSDNFLLATPERFVLGAKVKIGISGNFLRPDIDRVTLLQIIAENANCQFDCWGSYTSLQSNIGGGEDPETADFIQRLKESSNVTLHGALPPSQLAIAMRTVDAFLICYDVEKDQSKGTNYHKVIEYLSAGRVIVANNITTYAKMPELVQMVNERNNQNLPHLFKNVISNLEEHNNELLCMNRFRFAQMNSYKKQVERIEAAINTA